jgi:SAM-dependent methyltransferase
MPARDPGSLPIPPVDLVRRIGLSEEEDPQRSYLDSGRESRELIEAHLPAGWTWAGKRVLDFGCGVGRVLRQFAAEAEEAEFFGCDLDRTSVSWLQDNFSPPFEAFESTEAASLPQEDGFFDLIYAFSVYTHFTDNWAAWLLEHHRVLAEGGILFATFLGEGMLEPLIGEEWDEDRIGMNPLMQGLSWEKGGPVAFNSPWWIRAHWGRAFEIVELVPRMRTDQPSHGLVVARKKPVEIGIEELTRLEPDEPREIAALAHHAEQLEAEVLRLRDAHKGMEAELAPRRAEAEAAHKQLEDMQSSRSWRITAPLRAAKRLRARD